MTRVWIQWKCQWLHLAFDIWLGVLYFYGVFSHERKTSSLVLRHNVLWEIDHRKYILRQSCRYGYKNPLSVENIPVWIKSQLFSAAIKLKTGKRSFFLFLFVTLGLENCSLLYWVSRLNFTRSPFRITQNNTVTFFLAPLRTKSLIALKTIGFVIVVGCLRAQKPVNVYFRGDHINVHKVRNKLSSMLLKVHLK